jgi:excisionase family DNA binding protein
MRTTMRECLEFESPSAGPLWNIREVARYLRMPVGSVYKMTGPKAKYRIPHLRLRGRLLRFRQRDIDRWLDLLLVSNSDLMVRVRQQALKVRGTDGQDQRKAAA